MEKKRRKEKKERRRKLKELKELEEIEKEKEKDLSSKYSVKSSMRKERKSKTVRIFKKLQQAISPPQKYNTVKSLMRLYKVSFES